MIIRTTAVLAGATLIALAETATAAEPLLLDDAQLDQARAGALPDIEITNIVGVAGPGGPAIAFDCGVPIFAPAPPG